VLAVVRWQRAVTLEYQNKAYPLKHYVEAVPTATGFYQLPAVMILRDKYVKYFRSKVKLSKKNVFVRDGYKCAYCGQRFKKDELTVDHVHPRCKGGKNTWENLVASCFPCNRRKGDNTAIKPKFKPTEPRDNQIFIIDRMQPEWKEYLYDSET